MSRQLSRRSALRVGLISDIHAHIADLDRALAVLEAVGVDRVVCLGDVVEKGPEPERVVERLDTLLIPTVQGNHDLNAVRHAQLEPRDRGMSWDTIAWLEALPRTREYVWAGKLVAMAHASLAPDWTGIRPGLVPKRMRRCLRRSDPDVVLLGHTHVPMCFGFRHHLLCNPGSISKGRCALGPTCAVLELPGRALEIYDARSGERLRAEWTD